MSCKNPTPVPSRGGKADARMAHEKTVNAWMARREGSLPKQGDLEDL